MQGAPRPPHSTAADVAALVERLVAPTKIKVTDARGAEREILALPTGLKPHSVKDLTKDYDAFPERPKGFANFTSLASIIAWVNRQKLAESVLFASNDMAKPSITAVINYHQPQANHAGLDGNIAGYGDHRGVYHFPLSKAWKAWAAAEQGGLMEQAEFARFLEDRITDVLIPPADGRSEADASILDLVNQLGGKLAGPSTLLTLSRGLAVHENSVVKNAVNLASGEAQFVYETTHAGENGQQLSVPNMFLIGVPVFEMGDLFRLPVRLRYRLSGGKVRWAISRHRPEMTFDVAFSEAVQKAATETDLPMFLGSPESASSA